jgi:hypothetical protein
MILTVNYIPNLQQTKNMKQNFRNLNLLRYYNVQHCTYMSKIAQQDAPIYSLFISVNCSTCFGWYLHPSSGAITVSTESGISVTVTATCR